MERFNLEVLVKKQTTSLWTYVYFTKAKFVNSFYCPDPENSTLIPDTKPFNFKLWNSFYLRNHSNPNVQKFLSAIQMARRNIGDYSLNLSSLVLSHLPTTEDGDPHFHGLSHIQYLDLSCNRFNAFPVDLLYFTQLRKLNMQQNALKCLPSVCMMKKWAGCLEELNLAQNMIATLPEPAELKKLSSLQVLRLSENKITSLSTIHGLEALRILDVQSNIISTLPKSICGLANLQELVLQSNLLASLPDSMAGMKSLKTVNISSNQLETFPTGVADLESLEILDLSFNKISTIPSTISSLKKLKSLNLSHNNITAVDEGIWQLKNLLSLTLDENDITTLSPQISNLTNLMRFSATKNLITEIPTEILLLKGLIELDLSHNHLQELNPAVGQLNALVRLNIKENHLTELPETLGNLAKNVKDFQADLAKFEHIPQAVTQKGPDAVLQHLSESLNGTHPTYRIKLMVAGKENVGKTSLLNSLRRKYKKGADNCQTISTDGIDIDNWSFHIEDQKGEMQNVDVSVWDMAGQEVYYTTHSFFLSEATIYILVWNVIEGESGTEGGESKIEYWIRALKARSGDSVPPAVFVVATHIDDPLCPKDLGANLLNAQRIKYKTLFPGLPLFFRAVSCLSGEGVDSLRKEIQQVAIKQKIMGRQLPNSWFTLEKFLHKESTKRMPPIMDHQAITLLGQACNITDSTSLFQALDFLHSTGSVIHFQKDAHGSDHESVVILDPRWLSNTLACLFTTRHQWSKNGFLQHRDLIHVWKPPLYPLELHRSLLALAEKFEIVYIIEKRNLNLAMPLTNSPSMTAINPNNSPSGMGGKNTVKNIRTNKIWKSESVLQIPGGGASLSISPRSPPSERKLINMHSDPELNLNGSVSDLPNEEAVNEVAHSQQDDLVILLPSLLPAERPRNLSSFWSDGPKIPTESQVARRYLVDFIPVGMFCRIIVRLLGLFKAKLFWRDGVLLETHEKDANGEPTGRILVEVFMARRTVDVSVRSAVGTGSIARIVLECVEALARDWCRLQIRTLVPCVHCLCAGASSTEVNTPIETRSGKKNSHSRPTIIKSTPYFFTIEKCEEAAVNGRSSMNCEKNGTMTPVKLNMLVPDLMMSDFAGNKIEFSDIKLGEKVGSGAAADVFRGEWMGKVVAVKMLLKAKGQNLEGKEVSVVSGGENFSNVFSQFRREAHVMNGLEHRNLVFFEGLVLSPLSLVTEFMTGGDLYHLIRKPDNNLTWEKRMQIATDIAAGMAYLHRGGLIHRDLKSPNCMLSTGPDGNLIAKVCDFGLSGIQNIVTGRAVDNPMWLAPEILRGLDTAGLAEPTKIDVYSYGVILWELVSGGKAFFDEVTFNSKIEGMIKDGERPTIPSDCPTVYKNLLNACWHDDPAVRPSFDEIEEILQDVAAGLQLQNLIDSPIQLLRSPGGRPRAATEVLRTSRGSPTIAESRPSSYKLA